MKGKIYISGAINGTKDYLERFEVAEKKLVEDGYSVVNPAKIMSFLPTDTTYEQYMDMGIIMLDMCQQIYMLKGWEKSLGANREFGYALAKGMTILNEE